MPLRGLFYFARLYHGYIAEHEENIFSKSLIKLPTPRFVVFYNGLEKDEDSIELKLSDAFEIDASEEACLECVATMININFGHNKELMKNCRDLYEYAYLVEEVRKGGMQGLSLSDSVDRAVDTCINKDILKDSNNCIIFCMKDSEVEKLCKQYSISYLTDNSVNSGITVLYNGSRISFHSYAQNPQIMEGRTLVPLRSIFEAMGADVQWDSTTSTRSQPLSNARCQGIPSAPPPSR